MREASIVSLYFRYVFPHACIRAEICSHGTQLRLHGIGTQTAVIYLSCVSVFTRWAACLFRAVLSMVSDGPTLLSATFQATAFAAIWTTRRDDGAAPLMPYSGSSKCSEWHK